MEELVAAVRRFSRFYTRRIGLLHEGLLGGKLSLPEARLVYELAQREGPVIAKELGAELGLDSGYLSRLLRGLEERGLIAKRPSEADGRQVLLSLTGSGRRVFGTLDARSRAEIGALLEPLSAADRRALAEALGTAERLLGGEAAAPAVPYILRPPRPGDYGWVVSRHGALYAQEYRWDETFEALVAEIIAGFVQRFDPKRERCWIAEREGAVVGSVFLVRESDEVAKLRLLYVEPEARGLGIGRRLVEECVRAARQLGYARLTLWTNDVLAAARRIYAAAGFELVATEPHHSFGHQLVGENWELRLT
jgi:DNA-binding MarR family transcriptional regulator/N-acetylglutamate synthase-like GNAT family acetyltransferase